MVTLKKIEQASEVIKGKVIRTPLIFSPVLSHMFGGDIYLKLENLQKTGSFKIRGATYKLFSSRQQIGPEGVVTASAGNHAQGVAMAAMQFGVPATIVMPEWVSITKEEATRAYGGKVIIHGQSIKESLEEARRLADEGKTLFHPFDDPDIIIGQGTVGLEIFNELQKPDLIVVPIGGGGLISGIAKVAKSISPDTQVMGVQAAVCPSAYNSFIKGSICEVDEKASIADGISVKRVGQLCFSIIQELVDNIVLVEEEQIAAAILLLLERNKILTEGAGATPMAALLNSSITIPSDGKTVLVISGGNVDSPLLGRIISQGLIKNGRIMRIRVRMTDIPGSLAKLLGLIAGLKANVLHIYHDRGVKDTPIDVTHVELELETRNPMHQKEIEESLSNAGYKFKRS